MPLLLVKARALLRSGGDAAERVRGEVGEGQVAVDGHDGVGLGEQAAQDVLDALRPAEGEPVGIVAA
jgi:hypothetical protein